jgi:hypothetical protein
MVDLFSEPDEDTLSDLSGTVYLCDQHICIAVLPITAIHSVVAMFPDTHINTSGQISLTGKYSLMRHPYAEVARFTNDLSLGDKREEGEGPEEGTNSD